MNNEVCPSGSSKEQNIANSFAAHFGNVYHRADSRNEFTSEFYNLHAKLKKAYKFIPDFDT